MAYNMRKGAEGVARAILEYLQQNPATMERFLASVEKKYGDVTDHKEEAVRIPESIGEGQSRLDSLLVEFKDLTMQNVSEYHEIFNVIAGLEIKYDPEWDGEARCCKANRITVGPRFFTSGGIPREATVEQRAYLKTLTPHQRRLFMLAHEAAHGTKENRRVARKNPGRYRREIDPVEINATKQAIAWAKTVFKE
jgi:hypothetical protein